MNPTRALMCNILKLTLMGYLAHCVSAIAHDGHTHKVAVAACVEKQVSNDCGYVMGSENFYQGTCQQFGDALMCVRNKPIVPLEQVSPDLLKTLKVLPLTEQPVDHSHQH